MRIFRPFFSSTTSEPAVQFVDTGAGLEPNRHTNPFNVHLRCGHPACRSTRRRVGVRALPEPIPCVRPFTARSPRCQSMTRMGEPETKCGDVHDPSLVEDRVKLLSHVPDVRS